MCIPPRARVSERARWGALGLGLGLVAACRVPAESSSPADASAPPPPGAASPGVRPPAASIVSANLARVDDPELGGLDGLLVIFDTELDATAMRPRAFVVSRAETGPVWPKRALLAPASEDDENRSVLLVGEFGDATPEHQPTHVAVSGSLFAEDGSSVTGLGAAVMPFATPPRVVAFEVLASGPGRCEGAAQLLRTYWSAELRGVGPDDLERVRVHVGEAESAHPLRFDDHAAAYDESGQDNVLDLCMAEAEPLRQVWVEAGSFRDPAGHDSAAVELRIDARFVPPPEPGDDPDGEPGA